MKEYNQKRNFNKTVEPKGIKKSTSKNRFVVQFHKARSKHYDFRLEFDGVLLSWAVPKGISQNSSAKRLAVQVEDHPVDYINFQGVIPEGNYGAGSVEIWDAGDYIPIKDFKTGLKNGHLSFCLNGEKLKGVWDLIRIKDENWIIKKNKNNNIEISKTRLPFKKINVQLAELSDEIPAGKNWLFEIKYDGYRVVAFAENGNVQLMSRNGINYNKKFPLIVQALEKINKENFVLDGEVVSFDENGKSDFGLLQKNIKTGNNDFYYVVFDLLAENGEDLRNLPLLKRKERLEKLIFKEDESLVYSDSVENGEKCFQFAQKHGLEGVVAKKRQSKYLGSRVSDWLKIKCVLRQEFVIGGFTTTDKNQVLSALLVGYYKKNELIFVGKVGTGFSENLKLELHKKFKKIITKKQPFSDVLNIKNATWLKPVLVAEIKFAELTKDNLLRQPSFVGLRTDKAAKDVGLEVGFGIKNNKS